MNITSSQALDLLASICIAVPDALGCDGCFALIPAFADAQTSRDDLSLLLQAVQIHLSQCACCRYEYETLRESMLAAEASYRDP